MGGSCPINFIYYFPFFSSRIAFYPTYPTYPIYPIYPTYPTYPIYPIYSEQLFCCIFCYRNIYFNSALSNNLN